MKTLKIFIMLTVLGMLLNPVAQADTSDYTVRVSDAEGAQGESVVVPIVLQKTGAGIGDINNISFKIRYDKNKLTATNVEIGADAPSVWTVFFVNYDDDDGVSFVLFNNPSNPQPIAPGTEAIEVAKITFTVDAASGNTDTITPTEVLLNGIVVAQGNLLAGTFTVINRPPVLASIGNKTLDEGATLDVNVTATDPDNHSLSFSITGKPDFATFTDNGNGTALLRIAPAAGDNGTYGNVKITVTDDGSPAMSDDETITVTVDTPIVNLPPVLAYIGNKTIDVNVTTTLDVNITASDPDVGDSLSFSISGKPDFATFTDNGNGTARLSITPDADDEGTYPNIEITVEDDATPALSDAETIMITITDSFDPSVSPWPVKGDPNGEFGYPIRGTAHAGPAEIALGDWVGVFDSPDADANCYGAAQYTEYTTLNQYDMTVSAADPRFGTEGFTSKQRMYFKFYIVDTRETLEAISAVEIEGKLKPKVEEYPEFEPGDEYREDGPAIINLVTPDEQKLILKDGWNFISFNVHPESEKIEDVFSSILSTENDYLKYVSNHDAFWWKDASPESGGSLANADALHSYFIFIDLPGEGETYELAIKGIKVQLPKTFPLVAGWNNISYLYDESYLTIYTGPDTGAGIFDVDPIKDNMFWIKGPGGKWVMPNPPVGTLVMNHGDGFYIKMAAPDTYTYVDAPLD